VAPWLPLQPQARALAGLVLISPNLGGRDPAAELLLLPWARYLAPLIHGPAYAWQPVNALHSRYWTSCYPTQALLPLMAHVDQVWREPLERISMPVLTLQFPARPGDRRGARARSRIDTRRPREAPLEAGPALEAV
jgi:hypothetical protein